MDQAAIDSYGIEKVVLGTVDHPLPFIIILHLLPMEMIKSMRVIHP